MEPFYPVHCRKAMSLKPLKIVIYVRTHIDFICNRQRTRRNCSADLLRCRHELARSCGFYFPGNSHCCPSLSVSPTNFREFSFKHFLLSAIYTTRITSISTNANTRRSVQGCYSGLLSVKIPALQLRSSHFLGYGAEYYAYIVSETIASLYCLR
ncbi:mitochondrial intermediate peptidase-like [Drosophila eugracilis]|uniref:mitochondrial intermediate peptidase-like n=1 Tax=Drosophila eugracilis TaxID=29029 RepID=UPI001BD9F49D|nr:mitochondrial intermediate peptidase-like [Drosophila eugracilis]